MAVSVDFSRFAPLLGEETVQAAQAPFQTSAFPKVRIYPAGRAISSSGRSAVCPRSVSFRVECRAGAFSSVTARYGTIAQIAEKVEVQEALLPLNRRMDYCRSPCSFRATPAGRYPPTAVVPTGHPLPYGACRGFRAARRSGHPVDATAEGS